LQRVLTTVTLLGLLVATAAAFAITEHLKLIKSPVQGVLVSKVFSPVCRCSTRTAAVRVKLRRHDHVTVKILDAGYHDVATLAAGYDLQRHQAKTFRWDGRTDSGTRAPDGSYYPEINLADARRKFLLLANRIVLDTTTPRVLSASAGSRVLFVGRGRGIPIRYAFSEPANAIVYLGRRQILRGRPSKTHAVIKWSGRVDGRPVPAGSYVLSVAARDAAGNETPPAGRKHVRVVVRYIDVSPHVLTVRAGSKFDVHIVMRAPRYTWRLGKRHGSRRGRLLRLRAPTTPGTYHLVVGEHGHTAAAVVRVRRK
jgi:flagellar hook assembly protein FlgD